MAAMLSTPNTRRALVSPVLEGWGCMRPLEITGEKAIENGDTPFNWDDIDLKHGRATVRPEVAKKGDQRTIRLQPVAVKWLRLCKELGNPLPTVNERRLIDEACSFIDFEWHRDAFRKCCATHLRTIYRADYEVVRLRKFCARDVGKLRQAAGSRAGLKSVVGHRSGKGAEVFEERQVEETGYGIFLRSTSTVSQCQRQSTRESLYG